MRLKLGPGHALFATLERKLHLVFAHSALQAQNDLLGRLGLCTSQAGKHNMAEWGEYDGRTFLWKTGLV